MLEPGSTDHARVWARGTTITDPVHVEMPAITGISLVSITESP